MDSASFKKNLQTHFFIEPKPLFNKNSSFVFMGSCFSENILNRLNQLDVSCIGAPFGTLYNSYSILDNVLRVAQKRKLTEEDILVAAQYCVCWQQSHKKQMPNLQLLKERIAAEDAELLQVFHTTQAVCITLGSSLVYELKDQNKIVGNCHKQPQSLFQKKQMSVKDIISQLELLCQTLKSINPQIKILFTISPVKHLRDGITENLRSKSHLILAIQYLLEMNLYQDWVQYFPAFEIVTEELRDHRFYTNDLAHPTDWTIDYIFERFVETYFDPNFWIYKQEKMKEIKASKHRNHQ